MEIAGGEDKRQLTAVLTCTMSGQHKLRIHAGTSPACLPKVYLPAGWNLILLKITGLMRNL